MSKGTLNQVNLIGRSGSDPKIYRTEGGLVIANFNLATNRAAKDKQTGEFENITEWHKIALFGKSAEKAEKNLKKGDLIHILGEIRTEKYADKQTGEEKSTIKIISYSLEILVRRDNNSTGGQQQASNNQQQGSHRGNQTMQKTYPRDGGVGQSKVPQSPPVDQEFDDDIPF